MGRQPPISGTSGLVLIVGRRRYMECHHPNYGTSAAHIPNNGTSSPRHAQLWDVAAPRPKPILIKYSWTSIKPGLVPTIPDHNPEALSPTERMWVEDLKSRDGYPLLAPGGVGQIILRAGITVCGICVGCQCLGGTWVEWLYFYFYFLFILEDR